MKQLKLPRKNLQTKKSQKNNPYFNVFYFKGPVILTGP